LLLSLAWSPWPVQTTQACCKTTPEQVPIFCPGRCRVQRAESSQDKVKLRKFQMASPLLSMTRKYLSQMKISTSKTSSPDAREVVDGVRQNSCLSSLHRRDPILIIKDTNMLISATRQTKQPASPEVNLITRGTGLARSPRNLDDEKLALFKLGPSCLLMRCGPSSRCRCFRSSVHWWRPSLPSGSCDSFDVIEVALVIDSYLCAYAGGKQC
jgi:hypothetical protein